jgi:hypothetical protein
VDEGSGERSRPSSVPPRHDRTAVRQLDLRATVFCKIQPLLSLRFADISSFVIYRHATVFEHRRFILACAYDFARLVQVESKVSLLVLLSYMLIAERVV